MPSLNISLLDSPIDTMDQAVLDNRYHSSHEATNLLQSPSRVSKSESEQTTSKASTRKGNECSTEAHHEKEKRAISETPEEKKKRRQERKEKKEQKENKKSRKESALSETIKEEKTTARRGSIAGNGTVNGNASTNGSITRNGFGGIVGRRGQPRRRSTVCSQVNQEVYAAKDGSVGTCKSCFSTEEMKAKVHGELNLLRHNAKTLSCQLKTANETIRQLSDRKTRMSDLAAQLVEKEKRLKYRTEENKEYSSRIRALEQALILQESELDNALTVIRQNYQAKLERDSLETGKAINPFAIEEVNDFFLKLVASEAIDDKCSIHKELIGSEEVGDQLSIRNELDAVRGELEQAQQERDIAVDKASIQLAEFKAETDECRDQLTGSHALIEQLRALIRQRNSPSSTGAIKRGFFLSKDNDKPGMPTSDNEFIDANKDIRSVSLEDRNERNEMDYHRRRQEEAYWNQPCRRNQRNSTQTL